LLLNSVGLVIGQAPLIRVMRRSYIIAHLI